MTHTDRLHCCHGNSLRAFVCRPCWLVVLLVLIVVSVCTLGNVQSNGSASFGVVT